MQQAHFSISNTGDTSRTLYLKTFAIIAAVALLHVAGQWRTVPLVNTVASVIICTALALLMSYALTRTPLTKSISIDYAKQQIAISYTDIFRTDNQLQIPFSQLSIETDNSFATTGYGLKWKADVFSNHQKVYTIHSDEFGNHSETNMELLLQKLLLVAL